MRVAAWYIVLMMTGMGVAQAQSSVRPSLKTSPGLQVRKLQEEDMAVYLIGDQMKALDSFDSTDCPRAWKETLTTQPRVTQGYGKSTAGTQVSSTCMALAAFGFAQYDSKRLVVREGDKVVRKLCATFDAMSDDVLKTTLHATARVTYSPTGASVTVR